MPILPIYIQSINITLLGVVRLNVIPVDRPTVLKALVTSKSASESEHFSNIRIPIVAKIIIMIAVKIMVSALEKSPSGSLFLNISSWVLPLRAFNAPVVTTANVVVLIPPPVPPGDAPINISMVRKNRENCVRLPVGRVLNPAVLAVIDWKKLAIT